VALAFGAGTSWALEPKRADGDLAAREFFLPELYLSTSNVPLADALDRLPNRAAWERLLAETAAAGGSELNAFIDGRSGSASNVMGAFPLLPGTGVGNRLTLGDLGARLGRAVEAVDSRAVAEAAHRFVAERADILGVDARQFGPVRATQVNDYLWQVSIPQEVGGVRVRDARLVLTVNHGNVVTFGTETWAPVTIRVQPGIDAEKALVAGFEYAGGRSLADVVDSEPQLEIVPVAPPEHQRGEAFGGEPGQGVRHRLVWTFIFQRPPDGARWEAMVDAQTGDVIAFQDKNHYVARQFKGGVYPVTSTGICPNNATCGIMQSGWPMPFANTGLAAPNDFTNSAGIYDYTSGTATTSLAGRFVRMVDNCGAISGSTTTGDLDLGGTNNQHDCTTGTGGGLGNTPASRSGFYELNKLVEQAKGWLPANTWLNSQLTSNMNINQTCNAFWNGSTVNFYRSGGGCRNTGELAAVFDHEWGHGIDDFDANGVLSNSSEAYADIAAIYRLQASCVGHGFFDASSAGACGFTVDGTGRNANESQTGTHCATDCSGVRDSDWAKHADNTPDTALGFVCTHCLASSGPCGRQVHCAAAPTRQAAWDLVTRDLINPPFGLDSQTAFVIGNKVFYQGSGNVGLWHACTCGGTSDGCASANGYIQWLTADDDNGNLADGTPHMTAIHAAFNRHGIACATPTPTNSGCAGGPTTAPTLTATPGNNSVALTWNAVAGASTYWVMRTEGHAGCNFGKALIATVAGTSYTDTQVGNGRAYSYNVVAQGASSACYTRVSNCATVTPTSGGTPDFSVSCAPASLTIQQGSSANSTCTVTSTNGFNSAVALSCTGLPAGSSCSFVPGSVTPPANGSAASTLTVAVSTTAAGTYAFNVQGVSGALTRTAGMSLTVTTAPAPNFTVSVAPSSVSVTQGASASTTVTVASQNGFASAVTLSAAGLPAGVTAAFVPNPVTPPANGSVNSTLTLSASATATTGTFSVTISGVSGALTRTAPLTLTVNPSSPTCPLAAFDATLRAPRCSAVNNCCDTGASAVLGRDTIVGGPEPNQPNTINNSCADGTGGSFHADESNDRVKVFTLDGTPFAPGKTVRVEATVWAWSGSPTSDKVDLYYAANAAAPVWTFIATLTPSVAGSQVLAANYVLPAGTLQAVRANFRYVGAASPCTTGTFDDRDDLIFAVGGGPVDNTAVFDQVLRAPSCASAGRSCDSGASLLLGRDTIVGGPEPNQPNTINNSCADGTGGTFHADESNDRLKVSTLDGTNLGPGKAVRIDATVWAWSGSPTSDKLDLYYASNAAAPVWTFLTTLTPALAGSQVLSATYTLPAVSGLHAIRANFRYVGAASTCSTGTFDDRDDLIFLVQ
jgi:hypothetical protein